LPPFERKAKTNNGEANSIDTLEELKPLLTELGLLWAKSEKRPRPTQSTLRAWDEQLEAWIKSTNLPLLWRKDKRKGETINCSNGRYITFSDNSPATWAYGLALRGEVPSITSWTTDDILKIPVKFIKMKDDLNRRGWKICHIKPVSDRKKRVIEQALIDDIEDGFRRFMSPRNIFVVPKSRAGLGEIQEVIDAVEEFERNASV
jgi:hypothetical protein